MSTDPSAIRIRCLETGEVRAKVGERGLPRYVLDRWRDCTLPVNVFVIEHPQGVCVFDCGQTSRAAAPGYLPRWHPFLRLARFELTAEDEAGSQLRRMGTDPADVRWLVLSHLHTDHVGGIDPFTSAEVLVTRTEWFLATGIRGRLGGYLPQHWPAGLRPSLVDFTDGAVGPFAASRDLLGDGTMRLVPAPGHTPGHMAMIVHTERGGYLCCGDLIKTPAEIATACPAIDEFCRRERLTLLAAHDPGARERLG